MTLDGGARGRGLQPCAPSMPRLPRVPQPPTPHPPQPQETVRTEGEMSLEGKDELWRWVLASAGGPGGGCLSGLSFPICNLRTLVPALLVSWP